MPVDLEPLGAVGRYGPDRAFVRIALAGSDGSARATRSPTALEAAGHPVIRIELADPIDLGGEFVRWEVATAIAGAVLGIDPFDQPNVEEAKELTRDVLGRVTRRGATRPPRHRPDRRGDGLTLFGDAALRLTTRDGDVVGELRPTPRPPAPRRLPRASRRSSRRRRRATRRSPGSGRSLRDRTGARHDRRLRPALPPLDRPAPQGRRRRPAGSSS